MFRANIKLKFIFFLKKNLFVTYFMPAFLANRVHENYKLNYENIFLYHTTF